MWIARAHADYVKNMITGAAQMGRRDPWWYRPADGPMPPDARAHFMLARQVGVPYIVVYMKQGGTWSTTPSCSSWSRWKCVSC